LHLRIAPFYSWFFVWFVSLPPRPVTSWGFFPVHLWQQVSGYCKNTILEIVHWNRLSKLPTPQPSNLGWWEDNLWHSLQRGIRNLTTSLLTSKQHYPSCMQGRCDLLTYYWSYRCSVITRIVLIKRYLLFRDQIKRFENFVMLVLHFGLSINQEDSSLFLALWIYFVLSFWLVLKVFKMSVCISQCLQWWLGSSS